MSKPRLLTVESREDVTLIGLNDPEHLNAFSIALLEELHDAITTLAAQGSRKIIFHGHGPSFSSGAHMSEYLKTLQDIREHKAEAFYESERKILEIARILRRPTMFSVAAVHGWVIGFGVELALICDFVVATEDAQFWLSETAAGWNAGMGVANRLTRTVGAGWARRMLLLGDKLPARQAADLGLVARLAPSETLLDEALDVLATMSRFSPLAVQYQKKLLDILPNVATDDGMEIEVITGYWLAHTRDVREAAQAFVEKRKPVFTGE